MAIPMQTLYPNTFAKGVAGQIANEEKYDAISRTVETAAGIAFGQPAFRGANDHGAVAGGTFAAGGVATANTGNTGNATSSAVTTFAGALPGNYSVIFQTATTYTVTDPNGAFVGRGTTGVAFNTGGLSFTITAGATPMVAGDGFTIAVTYTANSMFLGIAVKTLAPEFPQNGGATITDGYPQYATGSFMTEGSIYVVAGATVTQGQRVYWNPATSRYTNTTTHIALPSAIRFDTGGANGDIVELSLGNRRV